MKILVTGSAGFIGFHLSQKLLESGHTVVGIDNLNSYYDVSLKEDRLALIGKQPLFSFIKMDLMEDDKLTILFEKHNFDVVFHLAAQAGVRYSIDNPKTYIESNIIGTFNILEQIRRHPKILLYYASSSSVYGNSEIVPFSTNDRTDNPVSLYAATKKSTEILAESYVNLYNLKITGFRFFTVYGPWGRPDMAYFSFTEKILRGEEILVFNRGNLERDFTHIDDVTAAIKKLMTYDTDKPIESVHNIFNIGNKNPIGILEFISVLEKVLGKDAVLKKVEMQKGDVIKTYADITPLQDLISFTPSMKLEDGLNSFVKWFEEYYGEQKNHDYQI
jgi:UDP-glucuronate 4-epimerase